MLRCERSEPRSTQGGGVCGGRHPILRGSLCSRLRMRGDGKGTEKSSEGGRMQFDAVIVGAGHNALAAGIHLAARGWSVGLFERSRRGGRGGARRGGDGSGLPPRPLCDEPWPFAGSPFHAAYAEGCRRTASPSRRRSTPSPRRCTTGAGRRVARPRRHAPAHRGAVARRCGGVAGAPRPLRVRRAAHLHAARLADDRPRDLARAVEGVAREGAGWLVDTAASSPPRRAPSWRRTSTRRKPAPPPLAARGMRLDFGPDVAGARFSPTWRRWPPELGMVVGEGGADTMIRAIVGTLQSLGGKRASSARSNQL